MLFTSTVVGLVSAALNDELVDRGRLETDAVEDTIDDTLNAVAGAVEDLGGTLSGLVVDGMTGFVGRKGIFVVKAGVSGEVERVDSGLEIVEGRVEP